MEQISAGKYQATAVHYTCTDNKHCTPTTFVNSTSYHSECHAFICDIENNVSLALPFLMFFLFVLGKLN